MRPRDLFRRLSLDVKLISSYLVILGIGGLAISAVGSWIVSTTIWREAQRTVTHDLAIARTVYDQRLELVRRTVEESAAGITVPRHVEAGDPAALAEYLRGVRSRGGLDLLGLTDPSGRPLLRTGGAPPAGDDAGLSTFAPVRSALSGRAAAATEVLPAGFLAGEDPGLARRARVPRVATPHAGPPAAPGTRSSAPGETVEPDELTAGLVLLAAAPVRDEDGRLLGTLYGGVLLSRDGALVDGVWERLYAAEGAGGGARGAVTVFQGDVRVATTVRDERGARAVGTRVSDEVRAAVLGRGETWHDRAFVVEDWYLSAYEPIRDGDGEIVGMLYVGLLEEAYVATRDRVISSFFAIATLGFGLVLAVTYRIIHGLTRPIREMAEATRSVAAGRFDHEVEVGTEGEIGLLAQSFNRMQRSLRGMRRDLEDAARTLEDKVRARTEELVQMQARVAQSERLASIGVLAAGVAHEINNPLGGILALTSLALEDLPAADPSRENLEEVVRQTRRCSEIVRHLLEFSRQHAVSAEEVDVNRLLEKTLGLLERQSIFHNVRVVRDFAAELPRVPADPSQLQQVVMNILMNAVQAMDERGTLTLGTHHDPERGEVVLTFRDTGCGIPADRIDRIFDPFFTTNRSGQGTGLGLSIAYGIVARHHGSIAVESEEGAGTTFTIRLPVEARFEAEAPVLDREPASAAG